MEEHTWSGCSPATSFDEVANHHAPNRRMASGDDSQFDQLKDIKASIYLQFLDLNICPRPHGYDLRHGQQGEQRT